ncbi:GDSL-type esterase/lipase family protein, partial [Streptomyces sp. NPDC006798]|uniref:GDSL-type esterase/lipase family protein n=1 Tax=Streptomyces sp. NPDC006798 TaxID=3155462 RepID=UPI0033F0130B
MISLSLLLGLLQTLFLPATPAAAAVSDHAVGTWNVHATAANLNAAHAVVTQKNLALMALQEVRDDALPNTPGTPTSVIPVERIDPHSPPGTTPTTVSVDQSTWTRGTSTLYLYRIKQIGGGIGVRQSSNRSIAVISRQQLAAGDLRVVVPRKDRKDKLPFLALGVKYVDTWFYSIHATTQTPRGDNNADLLIEDISLAQEQATDPHKNNWAALGDFNRVPIAEAGMDLEREKPLKGNLVLDPDERIINSGIQTSSSGNGAELDYMFAKGAATGYKATGLNQTGSDHRPVVFSTSNVDPGICPVPPAPAGGSGAAAGIDPCPMPPVRGEAIVSMGDSFISGEGGRWAGNGNTSEAGAWGTDRRAKCSPGEDCVYGNTAVDAPGNPDPPGKGCHRSDVAEITGADVDDIPREQRFNIACSGATTDHVTDQGFKGEPPQVSRLAELARDNDITLIVLSIGGNDLNFSGILRDCAIKYLTPLGGTCQASQEAAFAAALDTVRGKVAATLGKIRATMRAQGRSPETYRLVLQSYPNPIAPAGQNRYAQGPGYTRYTQGGCPFRDTDSDWAANSVVPRISAMLRTAAGMGNATFLDLQGAFAGHELCSTSAAQSTSNAGVTRDSAEWVRWVPYLTEFGNGPHQQGHQQEAIHPNAYGQEILSDCLTKLGSYMNSARSSAYSCGISSSGKPYVRSLDGGREGFVRIRNMKTNEVLDAHDNSADAWVVTGPQDDTKDSQRWLMRNMPETSPGVAGMSFQAQHNKQYLTSNSSRWAFLDGEPLGWTHSAGYGTGAAEGVLVTDLPDPTNTRPVSCLIQDPSEGIIGRKWVSRRICDETDQQQVWRIERIEPPEEQHHPVPRLAVMPLGDSITVGVGHSSCPTSADRANCQGYRLGLGDKLVQGGHAARVNFVGSQTNGGQKHEGHSGWTIEQVSNRVESWMVAAEPNVITLHIGSNNIEHNVDRANAPAKVEKLLDKIFGAAPDVTVVIAPIVPNSRTKDGEVLQPLVDTFNTKLKAIVKDQQDNKKRKLDLADFSAINNGDLADGLHPNSSGYAKMADAFYAGIKRAAAADWITETVPVVPPPAVPGIPGDYDIDLNGDGRADYVVLGENGSVKAYRHVSGANWDLLPITAPGSPQWTPEQVRFADLDGDGRADYVVLGPNGSVKA